MSQWFNASMDKFIECLDRQFDQLHTGSYELIRAISPDLLYHQPGQSNSAPLHSCGKHILRSAAIVEQAFGGITTNLWDDPFEWTLPEMLSTKAKVLEYLEEVEATRKRGFELFKSDDDLLREVMAPAGRVQLKLLLRDALERATDHQQRASATLKLFAEGTGSAVS